MISTAEILKRAKAAAAYPVAETEQKKELIYGKVRELLDGLLCKGAISAEKRDYMLSQLWELLYKREDR